MSTYLTIEVTNRIAVVLLALAVVAVAKAWAAVLQTRIVHRSRTQRLAMSLEGTEPEQRPRIIVAVGQLERSSTGRTDEDRADGGSLVDEDHRPPALTFVSRNAHEHHGD